MTKKELFVAVMLVSGCADDSVLSDAHDMAPNTADQGADITEMIVIEPPKKGEDEPCRTTLECERRLSCNPVFSVCMYGNNCLVDWIFSQTDDVPDDEGCIVDTPSSGLISAKECEVDADCAGSPRSERCQFRICQDFADCVTDADCPAPQTCFGDTDQPITRVCVP
jgi:hypothetical protein